MLDLKSGSPDFKSHPDHQLNLLQVAPGSTPPLRLYIAKWSASCHLGVLTWVYFNGFFHWPWKAPMGRGQWSIHTHTLLVNYSLLLKATMMFFSKIIITITVLLLPLAELEDEIPVKDPTVKKAKSWKLIAKALWDKITGVVIISLTIGAPYFENLAIWYFQSWNNFLVSWLWSQPASTCLSCELKEQIICLDHFFNWWSILVFLESKIAVFA